MRAKKRTTRALLVAALVLAAWITTVASIVWSYGKTDHAQKSDCIIVLGAAAYGDQPSPVFEERIKHAIELHHQGLAPKIIFTGGFGDGASHAESSVGSAYAMRNGLSSDSILTETESRTTLQNLIEAKALMKSANLESAIIVSDPLHLKRASIMAEDIDISAVTSPTPTSRYQSTKAKLSFLIREIYFYHHYLITGD